jgi:hypothetical protein
MPKPLLRLAEICLPVLIFAVMGLSLAAHVARVRLEESNSDNRQTAVEIDEADIDVQIKPARNQ